MRLAWQASTRWGISSCFSRRSPSLKRRDGSARNRDTKLSRELTGSTMAVHSVGPMPYLRRCAVIAGNVSHSG